VPATVRGPPRARLSGRVQRGQRLQGGSPLRAPTLHHRGTREPAVRDDERSLAAGLREQMELHGGAVPLVAAAP